MSCNLTSETTAAAAKKDTSVRLSSTKQHKPKLDPFVQQQQQMINSLITLNVSATSSTNKPMSINGYATSCVPGSCIRNAMTGYVYPFVRVGKRDELFLFKVSLCMGDYHPTSCFEEKKRWGKSASKIDRDDATQPLCLYYSDPEEYESHFSRTISIAFKKKWIQRCLDEYKERSVAQAAIL